MGSVAAAVGEEQQGRLAEEEGRWRRRRVSISSGGERKGGNRGKFRGLCACVRVRKEEGTRCHVEGCDCV